MTALSSNGSCLSLDNNERSGYRARELKSVYVDVRCNFKKLRLHKCFINKYNLYNQVGIVAINVLGSPEGIDGGARGGSVNVDLPAK